MAISRVGTASADGSSTAVSVTHGLTIIKGDVIVAGVHVNGNPTVSDNNGAYPLDADYNRANPISSKYYVYHRVAGDSEPAAYAWTLNATGRWSVVVRVYRGVDTRVVWDVAPAAGTTAVSSVNGTPATAPSITILTAGACGLVMVSGDQAPTTTTWSDPTNSYGDEKEEAGQQTQATYDRLGLAVGATGATSVTPSANEGWVAIQCALRALWRPNLMLMGVG